MKQVVSISLAILVLLVNMGFTYATHYCGGYAMESKVLLGATDLNCGMENMEETCANTFPGKNSFKKERCCDNKFIAIDIEDDFNSPIQKVSVEVKFVISFIYTFIQSPVIQNDQQFTFSEYPPPLPEQDFQVLYQRFLI